MTRIAILITFLFVIACGDYSWSGRVYPEVEEVWTLRNDNPFEPVFVKIIAVEDGWLQFVYQDSDGNFTRDITDAREWNFRLMFEKYEEE